MTPKSVLIGFGVALLLLAGLILLHHATGHPAPPPAPTLTRVDGACWSCGPHG